VSHDVVGVGGTKNKVDLRARFRLIAVDLPGHGFTRCPDVPLEPLIDPRFAAKFLRDVLRQLHVERVDCLGHSFGGLVVCYLDEITPGLVGRLVLLDSEGLPRCRNEFLPSERQLLGGFTGRVASSHFATRLFGGCTAPLSTLRHGSFLEAAADRGLREISEGLYRTPGFAPSEDRRKTYATLMRVAENYHAGRLSRSVRRTPATSGGTSRRSWKQG
jgi:pimeloyl-ACP methyl ester carboxylesterase